MQTLIQSEVKVKLASFDHPNYKLYKLKEKSNNSKFSLDHRFYQKLFVILLSACPFLIFPESPKDAEVLCKKYHSTETCLVW